MPEGPDRVQKNDPMMDLHAVIALGRRINISSKEDSEVF